MKTINSASHLKIVSFLAVLIASCFVVVIFHTNLMSLPLFGDELYFAAPNLDSTIKRLYNSNFGHPPLWSAQIILFYKLFGLKSIVAHTLALFYTTTLIFFISYSQYLRGSLSHAILALMFSISSFALFHEAHLYYSVNAMLLFCLLSFHYAHKKWTSIFFATLSCLILESGIMASLSFFIYYCYRREPKQALAYLIAPVSLLAHYLIAYCLDSQELINPALIKDLKLEALNFESILLSIKNFAQFFWHKSFHYGTKVLLLMSMICLIYKLIKVFCAQSNNQKSTNNDLIKISMTLYCFFLIVLYLFNTPATRDIIPIIIFLIYLCSHCLSKLSAPVVYFIIILIIGIDLQSSLKKMNGSHIARESQYTKYIGQILSQRKLPIIVSHQNYWRLKTLAPFIQLNEKLLNHTQTSLNEAHIIYCSDHDGGSFKKYCQTILKSKRRNAFYHFKFEDQYAYLFLR